METHTIIYVGLLLILFSFGSCVVMFNKIMNRLDEIYPRDEEP